VDTDLPLTSPPHDARGGAAPGEPWWAAAHREIVGPPTLPAGWRLLGWLATLGVMAATTGALAVMQAVAPA